MTESTNPQKAQLDKAEREQLEDIVTQMRERVEANVRFQLTQRKLDNRPERIDELDTETEQLVKAIDLEATDGESWSEALEKYVTSVGYTIVNRLTALRCMEVREFIEEEVTVFKQNGLTPAAETLVQEEFLLEDEAILEAYHNACDTFAEEIEILFDRSSAYSLIDPDDDTFEELCEMLDSVPSRIWRADDVLGWVYEYYNVKLLDDLRRKGNNEGLKPEDVPPANQFYTPHWVVRMLTDNSLGKLYLEHTGELQDVVEAQEAFSPDERKNRPLSPDKSPNISDFCTYLVPSEDEGEPTDFEHPEELRVIDPACGSGHFLLYAFDVLERIWRIETELARKEIPRKILKYNLYGVDLDMRACQLAAFNLYLKGRTRAEAEGADDFDMPGIGLVCADAKVADIDSVETVFEEVANDDPDIENALRRILDAFEETHGLGSLLDVRGTLADLFEDGSNVEGVQITLDDDPAANHTLGQVLHDLRMAVDEHQDSGSFLAQDLQSFIRLLDILAQNYDVALMNPPYGAGGKMPDVVQDYVEDNYSYKANYYVTFFEVCETIVKSDGRVGMLIPRSFLYKGRFTEFRTDFVGSKGGFDFLAEFGLGVLDNATVRTVGTVIRTDTHSNPVGTFYRLYDLSTEKKEARFIDTLSETDSEIKRKFEVPLSEFSKIPRTPICYSTPAEIRELYSKNKFIDTEQADISGESVGNAVSGLVTGLDSRFVRFFWESKKDDEFSPLAYGGSESWISPQIKDTVKWGDDGTVMKRSSKSVRTPNDEFYGDAGLTWTRIKDTTRRFGYYPGGLFETSSFMIFPEDNSIVWSLMAVLNSDLYNSLFLSQTPEKEWDADVLACLPWIDEVEAISELKDMAKSQYNIVMNQRIQNPTSPYYVGPSLYPDTTELSFFYEHSHNKSVKNQLDIDSNFHSSKTSFQKSTHESRKRKLRQKQELEQLSSKINKKVYDAANLAEETREAALTEIYLRTGEAPETRQVPTPESVPKVPENIDEQVKDLVHHFAMEVVREKDDGIVPLKGTDDQLDMLGRIVERFEDTYGKHAEDRLAEADGILGIQSAGAEEAYPNLRQWISENLFDYHMNRMENTPIVWRLTTERLIADSKSEGFACFIDYHSINSGLFDRLTNQYLELRKIELRERRAAADRRRSDKSLSASEQAEAAEQYERCSDGLDQINFFEDVIQELANNDEREFNDQSRQLARELASKIAIFREETHERVNILKKLHEQNSDSWFKDVFSDKFWEKVDEWREEWVDALDELEYACEEYSKPVNEPVEAHLADLFDYFNWRLKGTDHYSSTGILFMTYYFEREGADLLGDDGQPYEHLSDRRCLLGSLASGINDSSCVDKRYLKMVADDDGVDSIEDLPPLAEFKALAKEIGDHCQIISNRIPSDWSDRALSEITTEGYQPNHKHGVDINIKPFVEAKIVPKTVDENIL